jgi:hypothetical protein
MSFIPPSYSPVALARFKFHTQRSVELQQKWRLALTRRDGAVQPLRNKTGEFLSRHCKNIHMSAVTLFIVTGML